MPNNHVLTWERTALHKSLEGLELPVKLTQGQVGWNSSLVDTALEAPAWSWEGNRPPYSTQLSSVVDA